MVYRVLERDLVRGEGFEIRKYPPHKRTISVCGRDYFLPFPHVVFGCFRTPHYTTLSVAFAKESDQYIYFPSLPNVCDENYIVCLGYGIAGTWRTHFSHSPKLTFEELIARFWQSDFSPIGDWTSSDESLRVNYESFHDWVRLASVDVVLEKLRYGKREFVRFFDCVVDGLEFAASYDRHDR